MTLDQSPGVSAVEEAGQHEHEIGREEDRCDHCWSLMFGPSCDVFDLVAVGEAERLDAHLRLDEVNVHMLVG